MRILIVGAGAVGGYFGARLGAAGRDITFLVKPARAEQLRTEGLHVFSPHGNTHVKPRAIIAQDIEGPYDVVLLGVKAYSLDSTVNDCAPAIGPKTMILPVLNGMRHIDVLAHRFGDRPVLGGVCLVTAEMDDAGTITQLTGTQQLVYGERSGAVTPRTQALDATLQGAGFDASLSTNIMQAMWEKWVMLASLGAITCLLRGSIGEVVAAPGGTAIVLQILDEATAIATSCGFKPSAEFRNKWIPIMTAPGSQQTSSMYRDLRKGAPVEVDQILGDLLERGENHGVSTPYLRAAYTNLRIFQATVSEKHAINVLKAS